MTYFFCSYPLYLAIWRGFPYCKKKRNSKLKTAEERFFSRNQCGKATVNITCETQGFSRMKCIHFADLSFSHGIMFMNSLYAFTISYFFWPLIKRQFQHTAVTFSSEASDVSQPFTHLLTDQRIKRPGAPIESLVLAKSLVSKQAQTYMVRKRILTPKGPKHSQSLARTWPL